LIILLDCVVSYHSLSGLTGTYLDLPMTRYN
jgi:hypothetical protein